MGTGLLVSEAMFIAPMLAVSTATKITRAVHWLGPSQSYGLISGSALWSFPFWWRQELDLGPAE